MRATPVRVVDARPAMAPTAESAARRGEVRELFDRVAAATPPVERFSRRLSRERFVLRGDVVGRRVTLEVVGVDRGRGCDEVAEPLKRGLVMLEPGDFRDCSERGAPGCLLWVRKGLLDVLGPVARRGADAREAPREANPDRREGACVAFALRDMDRRGLLRLEELREVDRDRCAPEKERLLRPNERLLRLDERLLCLADERPVLA